MSDRILVADADAVSREMIASHLGENGWRVVCAADGAAALGEIRAEPTALVVLDLALPVISGLELCRRVRNDAETASVPLLVVSARASEIDRVVAFEVGVDDFIEKPFSGRELALRVRAVLRRSAAPVAQTPENLKIGALAIDGARHRVTVAGRAIALTALELRLLTFLAANRERVHSRETLLERVWGLDPDLETRTVDTHIKRLRAKLGEAGRLIETLRGVGYRLSAVGESHR